MQTRRQRFNLRHDQEDGSEEKEIKKGQRTIIITTVVALRTLWCLHTSLTDRKGGGMAITPKGYLFVLTRAVAISALLLAFPYLSSAEHPTEHPSGKRSSGAAQKPLTKQEMKEAIESYIEKESKKYGGYYEIYDDLQGKELFLKLKKVHDDKLAHVGNDVYFFCVDLTGKDGKVYDLDFFMKRGASGNLDVTEVTIHKQEGKERYTWYEENGIWKKSWLVQKNLVPGETLPAAKPAVGDHPNPMPPR
ncbi:MAG TPA: hypothetical protein VEJ22_03385 [Nitrospirota bacterium]|nr:hypothetical protein [Nitrospirota bacterium]